LLTERYDYPSYLYAMKVTALIPNGLVSEVKELTNGKNITDALVKALSEWVSIQKIRKLNQTVADNPLKFDDDSDAETLRELNRK